MKQEKKCPHLWRLRGGLFLFYCFAFSFFYHIDLAAQSASQTKNTFLTLQFRDKPLKEIFREIEQRTEFSFAYNDAIVDVNQPVDLLARNKSLSEILEALSMQAPVVFKIINTNIYVSSAREPGQSQRLGASDLPALSSESSREELQAGTFARNARMDIDPDRLRPGYLAVSGRVLSREDGLPLPGVNIRIQGTALGTVTDAQGYFSLPTPADGALLFSYIGFINQEVPVQGRSRLEVALSGETEELAEVVVTALGLPKEGRKLGYATANVDAEVLATNRTTNIGNSLQGRVAGLNVSPLPTGPGGSSKIRIRGSSSFKGDNSPLIIVNGVPINNTNFSSRRNDSEGNTTRGTSYSDGGDGLLSINPDDIRSITVLKGATAAALYGFRAKDGAIVITTKSGQRNAGIGVSFNSNFVADRAIDQTDFQYVYGQGERGRRPQNANEAANTGTWSFGERLDGRPTVQFDGVERPYAAVRGRINEFFQPGYSWANTLALSGGNERGSFNLSLSHLDNESIMPNSGFDRTSANIGINYNLSKRLLLSANANYSKEDYQNPPNVTSQILNANTTLYTLANTIPYNVLEEKRSDGHGNERNISRFTPRTNPYWAAYERFENIDRDRIFGNLSLRYDLLDWLYIQGRIGQDYFVRSNDYNVPTGTRFLGLAPSGFNGEYYQERRTFRETNLDFLIGAQRRFGDFGIDVNFGGNRMTQVSDNNNVQVENFNIRDLYTVQNGINKDPRYSYAKKKVNSLYGAVEFSFKDLLFLSVTGRNDWFSTLNPKTNNYLYPSVSGSFVFSDAFDLAGRWLNFGKLRVAYAEVGGDTDPYRDNLYYSLRPHPLAGQTLGFINGSTSPNAHLRPLKVKELEMGLEMRLFDDRVGVDVAVYNKLTVDEILPVQISNSTGYEATLVNVGRLRNRGIELLLTLNPIRRSNFRWDVLLNGSYNISKVLELAGGQPSIVVGFGEYTGQLAHEVGMPMASLQGFAYDRTPDGQLIFTGGRHTRGPLTTFGSAIPKWVGGVINNFEIGGIELSFLVDFKFGHKLISNTNFNVWRHGLHQGTLPGRESGVIGEGVKPDPENPGQYIVNDELVEAQTFYETVRARNLAEEFVYNAGFVKLRQITLGYDFGRLFGPDSVIKGLRLSAVAGNVAVIWKDVPNVDPEMITGASDNVQGLESGGLPIARSMGMNINVRF